MRLLYLEKGECGCLKKLGSYMVLSVSFMYNALSYAN